MGADVFVENLKKVIEPIGADDEVICFGDIIGGSPLTNTLNTLSERGLIPRTVALGGMAYPDFEPNYDRFPETRIEGFDAEAFEGWAGVGAAIVRAME